MKILEPTEDAISEAVTALRNGWLVGLPTETVYGIAAIATDEGAVRSTFALKGRPAENPLIVHVASMRQVEAITLSIPGLAIKLAEAFWPGPMTLVLPKSSIVPDTVTGGLGTVAVRIPRHPVALRILKAVNAPLSAPSANEFMGLSPTRAEHISPRILQGLACVIDGGPCEIGVESTVVDCSSQRPAILRPGGITQEQVESVIGSLSQFQPFERRSPGLYAKHYSPKTPLRLVSELDPTGAGIVFGEPQNQDQIQLPSDPAGFASKLYATLFELDGRGLNEILVEAPPRSNEWAAVWDRLSKAAASSDVV